MPTHQSSFQRPANASPSMTVTSSAELQRLGVAGIQQKSHTLHTTGKASNSREICNPVQEIPPINQSLANKHDAFYPVERLHELSGRHGFPGGLKRPAPVTTGRNVDRSFRNACARLTRDCCQFPVPAFFSEDCKITECHPMAGQACCFAGKPHLFAVAISRASCWNRIP